MPKYRVELCQEVWEYYHIEVDAADEEEAEELAKARLVCDVESGDPAEFPPPLEPDKTDGPGPAEVIDVREVTEA